MDEQELDSIALRLSKKNKSLAESLRGEARILTEAPDDEDGADVSGEVMNDLPDPDIDTSESPEEDEPFNPKSKLLSKMRHMTSDSSEDETEESDEEDPGEVTADKNLDLDEEEKDNKNPLDNPYAVLFDIGQRVTLVYTDGSSTSVDATIEGYDKEGFYRIRLDSGLTISGLTDICLAEYFQSNLHESACICGCNTFVEENGVRVCDQCGRPIKEDLDQLKQLDNMDTKSKSKKVIRAEQHPVSTAVKPNIQENLKDRIKSAFKR